jgi:hypothetical protein
MAKPHQAMEDRVISLDEITALQEQYSGPALVHKAAQMYIRKGFYVIPIMKNGKAIPPTSHGVNYSHSSRNPKTIENWFGPEGAFYGWNIGLACGRIDGIFAVDIDVRKANGLKAWDIMALDRAYTYEGPVAFTPSGGQHLLFRWQDDCRSSTDKLAIGIDTRGGDEHVCRSHIVAWPSIIDDAQYSWARGGLAQPVPQFILESMGRWKEPLPSPTGGKGNEEVEETDLIPLVPLEKISEMLACLQIDRMSYDEWLSIGMAIHSQYPGSDGMTIWEGWSMPGKRYKAKECVNRWNGFDASRGTTIGTLIFHAKTAGWQASEEDEDIDPIGAMVARINKTYAVMVTGSDYRILQEQHDWKEHHANGLAVPRYKFLKKETFVAINASDRVEIATPKGKKLKPSSAIWLAHPGRRQYMGQIMVPGGNAPIGYFNQWAGWAVEPEKGDCSLWLAHVRDIVCDGNMEYYEWLMDWFADAIQNPGQPKGTAIVLQGTEGAGKGCIFESFGRLYGPHYVHVTSAERLTGKFNANQSNALLVFADEVMWGGNRAASGVLKGLVTERFIEIERKGIDAEMGVNMVRLLAASNEDWLVPAGPESRRWMVLRASDKKVGDKAYFNKLFSFFDVGMPHVLEYLMNREITSVLSKAPSTPWLLLQRAETATQDSMQMFWEREVAGNYAHIPYEKYEEDKLIVSCALLFESYSEWCREQHKPCRSRQAFSMRMNKYGCSTGPRIHEVRHYFLPTIEEARKTLNLGD